MSKTDCTGAVADKDALGLILRRNIEPNDAVWIGLLNTRGILGHCFIRVFMGTINCLKRKFFCAKGFGICYFNAEFALYIEYNVRGTISRLLLDCRKDPLTEISGSRLLVARVSNRRTSVLVHVLFDTKDIARTLNRGSIDPPTTILCICRPLPNAFWSLGVF
jgi:hypothetical protein